MPRSRKKRSAAALTACLGALAYTVSKVDLAREGELGMPGFPAPTDAYAAVADVETAQLADAALGLLMAFPVRTLSEAVAGAAPTDAPDGRCQLRSIATEACHGGAGLPSGSRPCGHSLAKIAGLSSRPNRESGRPWSAACR
ncbi:hypothetical protein [Streptomyces sp. A0592]|uniref:hypothetical protein n=1 Tax=Streptomyces sp. A0592 TaxID=2563099 RepID=UPI00109E7C96|nr:hypothetical protein [Streptomyces sp. A0592]THA81243.1 hypothetical protein E6U81_25765 [Streptomyces sp. A0592]